MSRGNIAPGAKVGQGIARYVGAAIYRARKGSCVSQKQAAEILAISQSNISKIEAGKTVPTAVQLLLLANRFNVKVGSFFEGFPYA